MSVDGQSTYPLSEKTLLHIEDDDAAAYVFRAALKEVRISAAVFRVSGTESALAFLNRVGIYRDAPRPDMIVVELKLSTVSGWELLEKLQISEELRSIPVVIFTNSSEPRDELRARALQVREYVVKTFDSELLLQFLHRVFSHLTQA